MSDLQAELLQLIQAVHTDVERQSDNCAHGTFNSWGLGVWYYAWDESSVDVNLGYRSFGLSWRRSRRPARDGLERLQRFLTDPTWGFGIYRDPDGIWAISLGPWLREFKREASHAD